MKISTKQEHDNKIEYMKEFFNNDFQPQVGLFWYDVKNQELFGVVSADANTLKFNQNGYKTVPKLHKQIWDKRKNKRFVGDYTLVPRGRVFEHKGSGFEVNVGNWINEHPEAKQIILDYFDLPKNTKFIIDEHWDIGNGWDE